MYNHDSLKKTLTVTDHSVECPVVGCERIVPRQRRVFRTDERFRCPEHRIIISPSTFEYERESDNLLWDGEEDRAFFDALKSVKRESRIGRENSEDAVTFNIFRYLERTSLLASFLQSFGPAVTDPELILWSYSKRQNGTYDLLNRARTEFGESIQRGSEPDIIIAAETALFFIEAKVLALNETKPSKPENLKKYLTGGDGWFNHVFKVGYEKVAIEVQRYELMRYWLLGSWMAHQLGVEFVLLSLVLDSREEGLEQEFNGYIVGDDRCRFGRYTWEGIYRFIQDNDDDSVDTQRVSEYFRKKCLGYDVNHQLVKAFTIE